MSSSLQPRHHLRHDDGRVECLELLGFCLQEKHASQQPMLASNMGCCSPGIQGSTMTSSSRGVQVLISQLYARQELRRLAPVHQQGLPTTDQLGLGGTAVVENPCSSDIWRHPLLECLAGKSGCFTDVVLCQFGVFKMVDLFRGLWRC